MKLIIAGSRGITSQLLVSYFAGKLLSKHNISEVVSGLCKGPDLLGKYWAEKKGIKVIEFPAEWKKYGNSAGFIRNHQMAEYGNACLCFWDGESRGTKNMIEHAQDQCDHVWVVQMVGKKYEMCYLS